MPKTKDTKQKVDNTIQIFRGEKRVVEQDWEKQFDDEFMKGKYNTPSLITFNRIKSFISKVAQEAYVNGKRDGMTQEAEYTENYIKEAESRGYERGKLAVVNKMKALDKADIDDAYNEGRKAAVEEVKEITKKWFDANAIEVVIGKDATRHFLSFIESSLTK